MLNVIMLNVKMLNVKMLNVKMLNVIDADCSTSFLSLMLSSDLRKANSALDKTTKMYYNTKVHNCILTAKAIGMSQE